MKKEMNSVEGGIQSDKGSLWNRWEPHIHTPGTALNDQFIGEDAWEGFLTGIETAEPQVRALGITDYFSIHRYKEVLVHREAGRLANIGFIFPNVELRLSIETSKATAINLHILFDPEPLDHIEEIERFLLGLEFNYRDSTYRCQKSDLIRLGKAHDFSINEDHVALSEGANQFKVNFDQLKTAWKNNAWVQSHALIAVAGGQKDGTSGLRDGKGSFDAFRKEIEGFCHIIFSGNPSQILFWQGKGKLGVDELEREYRGLKPCLHGSDAHAPDKIAQPDQDRRCWIKGDLTFESLRQTCIEPEGRIFIGPYPPKGALQGQAIRSVKVTNAPWLTKPEIDLNSGLVAVIGSRGSGKTALADIIAAGGSAHEPHSNEKSFVHRARRYLTSCQAQLTWETGETSQSSLGSVPDDDWGTLPQVQYLSQQFVDRLCSAEGLDDELISEIQRVIFNSHPVSDRMGASSFGELLDNRLKRSRISRERQQESLVKALDGLSEERAKKAGLAVIEKDRDEKKAAILKDQNDRRSLVPKGDELRAKRCEEISEAANQKRQVLDAAKLKLQTLLELQAEVKDFRDRRAPEIHADFKDGFREAGLSEGDWKHFSVVFSGDVDSTLLRLVADARKAVKSVEGPSDTDPPIQDDPDSLLVLIPDGTDLTKPTLSLLERELARLTALVNTDGTNRKRYNLLTEKITKAGTALEKVTKQIASAQGADERIKELQAVRKAAYQGVFEAVIDEESELKTLYDPIRQRLQAEAGSLSKLSFSVDRQVDIDSWAATGEALLDLRLSGPFKGRGELWRAAQSELLDAWQNGDAATAASALANFLKNHEEGLKKHRPEGLLFKDWVKPISAWLYGTDHIRVGYGLEYEGTKIEQLSPGTRGIVLLLLYLAIDSEDDRPLLIDQPEENLDPQSIFNELVYRFRDAKLRRQIIIVTHNANLVVNTDADQVIVASCGAHRPGQLPIITYLSGGLENETIRKAVCEILEGGERAFKERAKRLRVKL